MDREELLNAYKKDVAESLSSLVFSWEKLKAIELPQKNEKSLDKLEPWEALTSRFARATDIFLSKYIRLLVLSGDPGFRGEMRDFLDKAEKSGMLSSADQWMKIRELHNKIAHEYTREDLLKTFEQVMSFTPFVIAEMKRLKI
jgi:hypothetical protein